MRVLIFTNLLATTVPQTCQRAKKTKGSVFVELLLLAIVC
jgi:hypothetical protein